MADSAVNEGPLVLGVVITTLALGGIFIFLRTITRTIIRPQFSWDDALIIITWFLVLSYSLAMIVAVSRGYGRHAADLGPERASSVIEAEVIAEILACASYPTGKAAIAYLIHRIFPDKKLRWALIVLVAGNTICFYISVILIPAQCSPVAFQWDHSIPGGSCWDPSVVTNWGFLTGAYGALTDFSLAIIPWFYLIKLQMGLKEKLGIGIALSMGIFAGICSILKNYYNTTLSARSDYTFDTIPLIIWSCVELALINIAACVPTLRPLLLWIAGKETRGRSSKTASYDLRYRGLSHDHWPLGPGTNGNSRLRSLDGHAEGIHQSRTVDIEFLSYEDAHPSRDGNSIGVMATRASETL